MEIKKNIFFFGGIHGVGKTTICKNICDELKINYLSASEVIKWSELNKHSKVVSNVIDTQNRLLNGLENIVQKDQYYILDGHYCLLGDGNSILPIPMETFEAIKPSSLNLIVGDVKEIKARLEERDNKLYDISLLMRMQDMETEYCIKLSNNLKIPHNLMSSMNHTNMVNLIRKDIVK